MILSIIGGAAGVGKTSLLRQFDNIKQINTGDLFKEAMLLENRDEIRNGDWSILEKDVMVSMINVVSDALRSGQDLIIDTHFAAKICNKRYRIGLEEKYLIRFGEMILKSSSDINRRIKISIILISTNPYLLLTRRRLDKSRNRELIPSDCYKDLRCNDIYSHRYLSSLRRSHKNLRINDKMYEIKHHVIQNEVFDLSQKQLIEIIKGGG